MFLREDIKILPLLQLNDFVVAQLAGRGMVVIKIERGAALGRHVPWTGHHERETHAQIHRMRFELKAVQLWRKRDVAAFDPLKYLLLGNDSHIREATHRYRLKV